MAYIVEKIGDKTRMVQGLLDEFIGSRNKEDYFDGDGGGQNRIVPY